MRRGTRIVVHVSLDELPKRRGQSIDDVVSQALRLKACLEKFQEGWERPSADEAVWVTTVAGDAGYESVLDWVEKLRDQIHSSTELNASVGIATTRLAARVASRIAKPRGLLLLLPGYEKRFLSTVCLEEFDELRTAQVAALRRRGISTLGDLAGLTPGEARRLLGPEAVKLIGLVRGVENESERNAAGKLERDLADLCRRAAKKLERGRWGARGLELGLVYRDGISFERYRLMPQPAHGRHELESEAKNLLRLFPTRAVPVSGISLTATGLSPRPGQLSLFARPREVRVQIGRVS
jgi:DNA polymerase-4